MYVPDAGRGQKIVSDPLALELQKVVSHHMGVKELNPGFLEE